MDEQLLNQINKNLYDVQSLISSRGIKAELEKYKIDVNYFLKVIELYLSEFNLLKKGNNSNLLILLNEKLNYIINNNTDTSIKLYHRQLEASMHFIQKNSKALLYPVIKVYQYEDSIYLDAIKIKNYFSIKNIEIINLKDKKEIYFVGGNGDGKTILLQAIILALKKEYSGQIIEYIRDEKEMKLFVKDESSDEYSSAKNVKNVFAYGINRNKVREKFDEYGYSGLFDTSDFKDTTFLKNPLEFLRREGKLVQDFISKLNQYILVNDLKIEKDKNGKVSFKENNNEIDFETLSEGYKSSIIWICDLVSRLIGNQKEIKNLEDFKAIVLIDEVDLYLHPKWKYDFVYNLRKVFPNIQFLMITHSTATILGASEDAVFYKVYKEDGETQISQPMNSIKNLMANNLSTSPLFDMTTEKEKKKVKDYESRYKQSDIKKSLKLIYNEKCAFCEKKITECSDNNLEECSSTVEHYRPKSQYYWLAYSWDNLLWCCHRCNQNKDNNFEIDNSQVEYEESFKDKIHTSSKNYQEIEKPKMIHPEFESVLTKLRFNNGIIASDDERIKYIIETCGLDRDALNEERKTIIDDFIKVISDKELKNESISETLQELMNDFKKQEKEFIALRYWMLKNYKSLVEAR